MIKNHLHQKIRVKDRGSQEHQVLNYENLLLFIDIKFELSSFDSRLCPFSD